MRQTRETRVTRVLPEFSFPLTEKVGLADQSATTLLTPPLSALNCHSCAGLALGGQAQTHLDYEKPAGSIFSFYSTQFTLRDVFSSIFDQF